MKDVSGFPSFRPVQLSTEERIFVLGLVVTIAAVTILIIAISIGV